MVMEALARRTSRGDNPQSSRVGLLRGDGPRLLVTDCYLNTEETIEQPGRWRTRIAGYTFALLTSEGSEYLAYHLHEDSVSHVQTPHLHLGAGAALGWLPLVKAHLPTGAVLLPEVIALAIDLGARPQRADWRETLAQAALAEA